MTPHKITSPIGVEDIGNPVLVSGKSGYHLLSIEYTAGGLMAKVTDGRGESRQELKCISKGHME